MHPQLGAKASQLGSETRLSPVPESLVEGVAQRTKMQLSVAYETRSVLAALRDRLFGAAPEATSNGQPQTSPYGQAEELRDVQYGLSEVLSQINMLANELNNRI